MKERQRISPADFGRHCQKAQSRGTLVVALFAALAGIGLWRLSDGSAISTARAAAPEAVDETTAGKANASREVQSQPDETERVEPLSLDYVPRDCKFIAGARTSALRKSPALSSFNEFLAKDQQFEKQVGIPLERVEQILMVYFEENDGSAAVIFHVSRIEDVAAMLKAGQPDRQQDEYAGQTYLRRKNDDGKPNCVFANNKTVVVAQDEQHLRRIIAAGRTAASQAKWAEDWNARQNADAVVLLNIRKLRSQQALQGPFNLAQLILGVPTELAPLLEVKTAVLAIKAGDEIQANAELEINGSSDADKICNAAFALIELSQAVLSSERVEASGRPSKPGALELQLIDRIDGLLDRISVRKNGRSIEAGVTVTRDDVTNLVEKIQSLMTSD